MKILQLGKFYPIKGGVEKVMYDLMTGLSEQGIDCDMMCTFAGNGKQTFPVNSHAWLLGCKKWMQCASTMISPEMVFRLHRICKEYDVIHIHHPDPMACLALFFSGYKGRVILHWHSDIVKQKKLLHLYIPFQEWLVKRADVIVGTTPVYLKASPFIAGMQDKTCCLPIGVRPLPEMPEEAKSIRNRYPGKKIVFSLGRLIEYKGYRYLIEAANYLNDDYVILIGGTGPLQASLEQQIQRSGLEKKVYLLGFLPDSLLPAYYQACDMFCLSSIQKSEAFGIVQIEAMSCGKPVVATEIPGSGVPWVNKHGVSGLNVPVGDARALAGAITEILADDEKYAAFARQALERYRTCFTYEKMISNCLKIYSMR